MATDDRAQPQDASAANDRPARSTRRRVARLLEALLWVALLGYAGHRFWPQIAAALAAGAPGEFAPAAEVTMLDGQTWSLDALRGQVVLVHFWATWCRPCRIERPGLERVYRDRREDGLVVLSLATDRSAADVRDFLATRSVPYPVGMADPEMIRAFGGIRGTPTSFLIDREGRIRHRVFGIFTEPMLRLAVGRLLAEPATISANP
jgi:cytochrome c biogenesis protein CcmG, thiol:disulfide interchange protein DsbE